MAGHNQSIAVRCLSQFQPTTNLTTSCNNGTWSKVPKCIPAKCTELPDAPRNGMVSKQASSKHVEIIYHEQVVAPKLEHGNMGKFEVK